MHMEMMILQVDDLAMEVHNYHSADAWPVLECKKYAPWAHAPSTSTSELNPPACVPYNSVDLFMPFSLTQFTRSNLETQVASVWHICAFSQTAMDIGRVIKDLRPYLSPLECSS